MAADDIQDLKQKISTLHGLLLGVDGKGSWLVRLEDGIQELRTGQDAIIHELREIAARSIENEKQNAEIARRTTKLEERVTQLEGGLNGCVDWEDLSDYDAGSRAHGVNTWMAAFAGVSAAAAIVAGVLTVIGG